MTKPALAEAPWLEQYDPGAHYLMLKGWWHGHGQDAPPMEILPASGFVLPGICAMFLYTTNAKVGFVDHLISNPKFRDKRAMREALELVSEAVVHTADRLGLLRLSAHTTVVGQAKRAIRHGFKRKTVTLLVRTP